MKLSERFERDMHMHIDMPCHLCNYNTKPGTLYLIDILKECVRDVMYLCLNCACYLEDRLEHVTLEQYSALASMGGLAAIKALLKEARFECL